MCVTEALVKKQSLNFSDCKDLLPGPELKVMLFQSEPQDL